MNTRHHLASIFIAIFSAILSCPAESESRGISNELNEILDDIREFNEMFDGIRNEMPDEAQLKCEQDTTPANIRVIFDKAKKAEEEDANINFCGFYVGMSRADANALGSHYGLQPEESKFLGDPVDNIWFSLKGVRRITKGGNSYGELIGAVAASTAGAFSIEFASDRLGETESWYEYKTIDGVRLTMSEESLSSAGILAGLHLWDATGAICAIPTQKEKTSTEGQKEIMGIIAGMVPIPGKNYLMGKYEVMQSQWEAVMGENPSMLKSQENPVEQVSWDDCQAFLKKLNALPAVKESGLMFRLPTSAEWEYACRAGATGDYCKLADGTEITEDTLGQVAWFEDNSGKRTHSVGQKQPNAFGLYDMHGNVWEWTQTEDGEDRVFHRVFRGGCAFGPARLCESSFPPSFEPSSRIGNLGFRLCAEKR